MQKNGWQIVIANQDALSRVRHIGISPLLIVLCCLFLFLGLVGFTRLAVISSTYAFDSFGAKEEQQENRSLLLKTTFLSKFLQKEAEKIQELIAFEDNARLKYGLKRISYDVRMAGIGGLPSKDSPFIGNLLDPIVSRAEAVRESLVVLLRQAQLQDSTFTHMLNDINVIHSQWSQRPAISPTVGRLTSGYGYRMHPVLGENAFHDGLDIANKIGTPVHATADGIVKSAGHMDYYGMTIVIRHPSNGLETLYAHLNKIKVSAGQEIKRGDLIGMMGSTGRSTGPHLHYEVRQAGRPMNPTAFIIPSEQIVD